jgi:carotenoid 1,2-hydratase
MQVLLAGNNDAARQDALAVPGSYEWWYFDAIANDRSYSFVSIWLLGNPFSPYYRLSSVGRPDLPLDHAAVFFALYRRGSLESYHFTRFRQSAVALPPLPVALGLGPNRLIPRDGGWQLRVSDTNGNGRTVDAALEFAGKRVGGASPAPSEIRSGDHVWNPAMPSCRVSGSIALTGPQNHTPATIAFSGLGYHDRNWGQLPFGAESQEWYWARVALTPEVTAAIYAVKSEGSWVSTFLLFQNGMCVHCDDAPVVHLRAYRLNAFGLRYATRIDVVSRQFRARFSLRRRVDSSSFYIRCLSSGALSGWGKEHRGAGFGEYFRPAPMAGRIAASAMKARIVEAP